MIDNFDIALEKVLEHEGGWADHPDDPGGATMKGVTLATFRRHFGPDKTKDDLRNITDDQLKYIYKTGYWDECLCDELPTGVDYAVFDGAVNSGPSRSSRWLQGAVGAHPDGIVGPLTLAQVEIHYPETIIGRIYDQRLKFLKSLRTWRVFGRGWQRRVDDMWKFAIEMTKGDETWG